MDNVRLLSQGQIVQEWWQEVNGIFWEDSKMAVKRLLKELMESTMEEELTILTGTRSYERQNDKMRYRNGYHIRSLVTQFGTVDGIMVPRLRKTPFKTKVFKRYKRYEDIVEDLIEGIFLAGVSTRKVGDAISKLIGTKVSHGTVSNIVRRLDSRVNEFHNAPIIDEYQYLFLDGITLKIRYGGKYMNRKVLAAYGITLFGARKLLGFVQAKGESQDVWEGLLNRLYTRGLHGSNLKLITIDGAGGLRSALNVTYPHVPIQRCWAHKLRNVSNYLKKVHQEDCIADAREIYLADSRFEAITAFKNWKRVWGNKAPEAVHCLEKDLEELLAVFDCPKRHWIRIRTTNVIERSFKEVRRRVRVFSCFSNRQSCERIVYAIFTHLNRQWEDRPIKGFTQFV